MVSVSAIFRWLYFPLLITIPFFTLNTRTLVGYTNILVYGNEVQSGCKIIADGTPEADAVITIDFGQGNCTSGKTVTLNEGSVFVDENEVVTFGARYQTIIFAMTNCNDNVTILKTYTDASSIELLGYDGDDTIVLGDGSEALDTTIFAKNFIIDGGGGNNVLTINDQASSASKQVTSLPTMFTGIHGIGNETISYFDIDHINMSLGNLDTQVYIFSTAKEDWQMYSNANDPWLAETMECLKLICWMGELHRDVSLNLITQGKLWLKT